MKTAAELRGRVDDLEARVIAAQDRLLQEPDTQDARAECDGFMAEMAELRAQIEEHLSALDVEETR